MERIINFVNTLTKGTFGIEMLSITEPKMRKTNNPFYGRVKKATFMRNVAIGYNYENVVNNRLERQGNERSFVCEKPNGKTWLINGLILCADKDETKKYLRTTMRPNMTTHVVYLLDERVVTNKDIEAEIKSFMPKSAPSKKQSECGLSDENQVVVRDFTVENVLALVQGEKRYFKDEASHILFECLKQAFKTK